jgi:hypothetical protein
MSVHIVASPVHSQSNSASFAPTPTLNPASLRLCRSREQQVHGQLAAIRDVIGSLGRAFLAGDRELIAVAFERARTFEHKRVNTREIEIEIEISIFLGNL